MVQPVTRSVLRQGANACQAVVPLWDGVRTMLLVTVYALRSAWLSACQYVLL